MARADKWDVIGGGEINSGESSPLPPGPGLSPPFPGQASIGGRTAGPWAGGALHDTLSKAEQARAQQGKRISPERP